MIANFIAMVTLGALALVVQIANFWFVYGLWPKSWLLFAGFFFVSTVISILFTAVKGKD